MLPRIASRNADGLELLPRANTAQAELGALQLSKRAKTKVAGPALAGFTAGTNMITFVSAK
jgi:hypothetical protein